MRDLKTSDIFKMSKIMNKIKLRDQIGEMFGNAKGLEGKEAELGMTFIAMLFENMHLAENEISDFVGDIVGMTGQEFQDLPIKESIEIIKQLKERNDLADFFRQAGQLTK